MDCAGISFGLNFAAKVKKIFMSPENNPHYVRAKRWIEKFCINIGQEYQDLMSAAAHYLHAEDYTYDNSERYKHVSDDTWRIFWINYSVITGEKIPPEIAGDCFFTCSC